MQPIKFEGYNCVYAENQAEYLALPAYKHNDEHGTITACWRLGLLERIRVLFAGRIYISLLSFGQPLTPHLLETRNPVTNDSGVGEANG